MQTFRLMAAPALACVLACGADWLTDGGNSQRNGWQKDEKILTTANVKDMKLLWKLQLDNEPRQMHSLFPVLIVNSVNTPTGPRQVVIETGVSDNLYAIDAEKGDIIWTKHIGKTWAPRAAGGRAGGYIYPRT